jgi:hypothetical protein
VNVCIATFDHSDACGTTLVTNTSYMPSNEAIAIAVLIPAFNATGTIDRAIQSVLWQTRAARQIIVVDDGSSDGTAEYIRTRYIGLVDVIVERNRGPSAARNRALEAATASHVIFLDADDALHPRYIEEATRLHGAAPFDVMLSGWTSIDVHGASIERMPLKVVGSEGALAKWSVENVSAIQAVVVSRDLVTAVGGFDATLRQHEDWDLWLRVAEVARRIVVYEDCLSIVYATSGSNSSNVGGMHATAMIVLQRALRMLRHRGLCLEEVQDRYIGVRSAFWRQRWSMGVSRVVRDAASSNEMFCAALGWVSSAISRRVFR